MRLLKCLVLAMVMLLNVSCTSKGLYWDSGMDKLSLADLEIRANSSDAHALNELGRRYGLGINVPKDSEKSFALYKAAAEQGLAIAQANLGYMYFRGEGTQQNYALAREWLLKSARQGHFQAQSALGYMYIMGEGVDKNGKEAEHWYTLAANQGHVDSQYALYNMYANGNGVTKNSEKAVMWLHRVKEARLFGKVWKK